MDFKKVIESRYTTKKYDSSKKLTEEQIQDLKEILRLSPSSINSQPWKFTFIRDQHTKESLSKVSWLNTDRIIDSDCVVVFSRIDDIELFEAQITEELPERAVNYFEEFIKPLPIEQTRAWFDRQVYLALGVLLSACASMGIDSTPMEGIEPENYDKILGLENYKTIVAVAIGHRDKDDFNQPHKKPKTRRALEKVIQSI